MVFFIQPRGGMTRCLASWARRRAGRPLRVMLDGPYGGLKHKSLAAFKQVLLIAGGAGAGFTLPLLESFLQEAKTADLSGNTASSLKVVLAVKSEGEYKWYASVVQELLSSYTSTRDLVRLEIYVTETGSRNEVLAKDEEEGNSDDSPYGCTAEAAKYTQISLQHGHRPDLPSIIGETQVGAKQGSVAVAVCGPSSMLFDVRQAVATAQTACFHSKQREVYLHSEHFSW